MADVIRYTFNAAAQPADPDENSTIYTGAIPYPVGGGYYKARRFSDEGIYSIVSNKSLEREVVDDYVDKWLFENNLNSVKTALTMTAPNGITYETGVQGDKSGKFNGSNQYALITVNQTNYSQFTIVFWFKTPTGMSGKGLMQWATTLGSASQFMSLYFASNTTLSLNVNGGYNIANKAISVDTWTYCSIKRDATKWYLTLNTTTYEWTGARGTNGGTGIYFGNGYNGYSAINSDNVRFYPRCITTQEDTDIYNNEKP